jgi:hypothetical protein
MSLRTLAEKHLAEQSRLRFPQRDTPRGCPSGTNYSRAIKDADAGTNGTSGTGGTIGTARPSLTALQRRADARNDAARLAKLTDRFCRCGGLAGLAWPLAGRREVWFCRPARRLRCHLIPSVIRSGAGGADERDAVFDGGGRVGQRGLRAGSDPDLFRRRGEYCRD